MGEKQLHSTDARKQIAFLYKKYYQRLFVYANAFLFDQEESRDVVNDIFASAWNNGSYEDYDEKSFSVYAYKLVRSRCLDILRHQKVEQRYQQLAKVSDIFHSDEDVTEFENRIERLREAVEMLPDHGKEILKTCYYKQLTYKQTAEELNLSVHTVHKTLTRMYALLRKMLKNEK